MEKEDLRRGVMKSLVRFCLGVLEASAEAASSTSPRDPGGRNLPLSWRGGVSKSEFCKRLTF